MRMAKPFSIFMWAAADSLFYYIARLLPIVHRLEEFISQTQRKSDPSELSARESRFAIYFPIVDRKLTNELTIIVTM
jgi:hypothetical protein